MKTIRVLVVDDCARARRQLTRILESSPDIEVCGSACDPYDARAKIKGLHPDVLTLDIDMPRMDGITFLRNLMRLHPMPVVMVSCKSEQYSGANRLALHIGAHAFIEKPADDLQSIPEYFSEDVIQNIKTAAAKHNGSGQSSKPALPKAVVRNSADAVIEKQAVARHSNTAEPLIAIGASTGGTEAIREVLEKLPADSPAVVIAQHISLPFSTHFARRMDNASALAVCEAQDGEPILPGHAYIAPGNMHLLVLPEGDGYRCKLVEGPPVNHHTPSVDVLFRSAAQSAGPAAISVLLTGMGKDGAQGMKEMHEAGANTLVQDEQTSVVWGMPGAAVKLGVVECVLPIEKIAEKISSLHNAGSMKFKKLNRGSS